MINGKISILFGILALTASSFYLLKNTKLSDQEKNKANIVQQNLNNENKFISRDSCSIAISISNYKDYNDYDISIWIKNNYFSNIIAPFNMASLLNEDDNYPILDLWLLSSDGSTATLMKNNALKHMLLASANECLSFPKDRKGFEVDNRFSFNIGNVFGKYVPKHDRFFFEYRYSCDQAKKMMLASLDDKGYDVQPSDLINLNKTSYELKQDTIIGNVISGLADINEHVFSTSVYDR